MQETQFDSRVGKICWRRDRLPTPVFLGFPDSSVGKESACNVGDLGLIPRLGRSPREGKGYPFQYSGLENSMDCTVHGVTELDTTEKLSLHHKKRYKDRFNSKFFLLEKCLFSKLQVASILKLYVVEKAIIKLNPTQPLSLWSPTLKAIFMCSRLTLSFTFMKIRALTFGAIKPSQHWFRKPKVLFQ